jgi:hypothetical protein
MILSSKQIYLVISIIILTVSVGCDGRDRMHKTNEEVLIENKLLDSFSEVIEYFPETYTEIDKDTILSNGFKVKIKSFTNLNSSVLAVSKKDTIVYKEYFRDFINDISVFKNNQPLFDKRIDKTFLVNHFKNNDFIQNANVSIAVLNDIEIYSEKIEISLVFVDISKEEDLQKEYIDSGDDGVYISKLTVYDTGKYTIGKIEPSNYDF